MGVEDFVPKKKRGVEDHSNDAVTAKYSNKSGEYGKSLRKFEREKTHTHTHKKQEGRKRATGLREASKSYCSSSREKAQNPSNLY